MMDENEIVNLLLKELDYAYCDNCRYAIWEDDACDNCHRKYSGWSLSEDTAAYIAHQISLDEQGGKDINVTTTKAGDN